MALADLACTSQQPDTFLCAPSKTSTVQALLRKTPLTFTFISQPLESIREKATPGGRPVSVAALIETHESKDGQGQDPAESDLIKTFKLHINPSQSYYGHKTTINRNALHGRWPRTLDEDQDFVYYALKEVVPNNVACNGLCDWHTGGQLSEDAKVLRNSEETAKFWHIRDRQIRRMNHRSAVHRDEDELLAWTSVVPEIRLRDEEFQRALQSADDGDSLGTIPGAPHMSTSQSPAFSPGQVAVGAAILGSHQAAQSGREDDPVGMALQASYRNKAHSPAPDSQRARSKAAARTHFDARQNRRKQNESEQPSF